MGFDLQSVILTDEEVKMIFVLMIALALILVVAIGGFAGFSFAGICAGIAAVFAPTRNRRKRA